MSNGADCASTRAVVVDPSGRRSVTLALDDTTCTFVRTVSGVTKNPEPRPDDVSTTTTAGEARLTRSSSDAEAGAGVEGSASSGALRTGCAGAGVAPASAGDAALGSPDLASVSGRATGLADAVTVRFAVSADGPGLINHQPPPAPTAANATIMRATAAPVSASQRVSRRRRARCRPTGDSNRTGRWPRWAARAGRIRRIPSSSQTDRDRSRSVFGRSSRQTPYRCSQVCLGQVDTASPKRRRR